jgi:dolichyl-phosphate-mannose-protein mannosyltransferase
MEVVKRFILRAGRREYTVLCLLVILNLAIHFSIINNPPEVIFDEVYYVEDAQNILEEHTTERIEHPPLGKLLITSGIAVFGNNPVGWRTLPILFGTANIVLLYLICRRLRMSRMASNIAVFLLTFENLSFVHGGMAMLDVFSLTFMLFSFWFYLRRSYPLSAISVVLASLAKLTGVFALGIIFLHWLIARRTGKVRFIASMALAPVVFLLLMPVFEFAIYHHWTGLFSGIREMLDVSLSLTSSVAAHSFATRPWIWVIMPKVMPYFYGPHYFGAISFNLWALIIPAFLYMTFRAVKKDEAGLFGAVWFAGTYLVWIFVALITDRVTYIYYFYPAVGAICIGIGMGLSKLVDFWKERRDGKLRWMAIMFVVFFLMLHLGVFIILAPVNPWLVERLLVLLM